MDSKQRAGTLIWRLQQRPELVQKGEAKSTVGCMVEGAMVSAQVSASTVKSERGGDMVAGKRQGHSLCLAYFLDLHSV